VTDWHLTREQYERFLDCRTSKHENQKIVRHLLHGCASCSHLAESLSTLRGVRPGLLSFRHDDGAFGRRLASATDAKRRFTREKLRARALWAGHRHEPRQRRESSGASRG
jgi:hypothetical protein